jgi:hypothetical protein
MWGKRRTGRGGMISTKNGGKKKNAGKKKKKQTALVPRDHNSKEGAHQVCVSHTARKLNVAALFGKLGDPHQREQFRHPEQFFGKKKQKKTKKKKKKKKRIGKKKKKIC